MSDDEQKTGDERATFEHFSNEYAQALQAYKAIETQASTLMLFGGSDDLRDFVEKFIVMATNTRQLAVEKNEVHFAEWFQELIDKAERLRQGIART
jgi:hypothetical protein